ncbi:MAG: membrane protein insertion efficiency factor YidD [Gammaproteobacteria bacterium]|nr:membrane protein insertion efficiency factor YidD [Gammaproteobacteria bacterium]HBW83207.1 membrane protein insertion efficiency factor YidD [Gammaproteobacteria bacterium]
MPSSKQHIATNMMTKFLIGIINLYQKFFSLLFGTNCRFHPTCSHYFKEAIQTHGPLTGVMLGINRLGKCHPWHEGGLDPVPETIRKSEKKS